MIDADTTTTIDRLPTGAETVAWDLTDLYAGMDDPQLMADLDAADAEADALDSAYRGRIAALDAHEAAAMIARYEALVERAEEAIKADDVDVNAMMKGKFTLRDMYTQLEALNKMGPLKQIMGMLPMGSMQLPDGVYDVTSTKMVRYRIIMDSMTPGELDDPSLISSSRTFLNTSFSRGSPAIPLTRSACLPESFMPIMVATKGKTSSA